MEVSKPDLVFNKEKTEVTVTISIEEGVRYFIKEVVLKGDLLPELERELAAIKDEFVGKIYFVRRKLMLRTSLDEAYDAIGYADADFDIAVVKGDEPGDRITSYNVCYTKLLRRIPFQS